MEVTADQQTAAANDLKMKIENMKIENATSDSVTNFPVYFHIVMANGTVAGGNIS